MFGFLRVLWYFKHFLRIFVDDQMMTKKFRGIFILPKKFGKYRKTATFLRKVAVKVVAGEGFEPPTSGL